jgi:hypothetical protein
MKSKQKSQSIYTFVSFYCLTGDDVFLGSPFTNQLDLSPEFDFKEFLFSKSHFDVLKAISWGLIPLSVFLCTFQVYRKFPIQPYRNTFSYTTGSRNQSSMVMFASTTSQHFSTGESSSNPTTSKTSRKPAQPKILMSLTSDKGDKKPLISRILKSAKQQVSLVSNKRSTSAQQPKMHDNRDKNSLFSCCLDLNVFSSGKQTSDSLEALEEVLKHVSSQYDTTEYQIARKNFIESRSYSRTKLKEYREARNNKQSWDTELKEKFKSFIQHQEELKKLRKICFDAVKNIEQNMAKQPLVSKQDQPSSSSIRVDSFSNPDCISEEYQDTLVLTDNSDSRSVATDNQKLTI